MMTEVHFANESLDLQSRGGRLSADIQAVVAADYIRNLREETRKGFYGRLKQGLCPMFLLGAKALILLQAVAHPFQLGLQVLQSLLLPRDKLPIEFVVRQRSSRIIDDKM